MNKPKFFESGREIIEEAKIKLALTYHKLGNSQEAERVLETVKSSSPVYHRALLGKAWVASKQERYEAAIASAEKLLRLYPQSPEIYEAISLMGFCYDKIGEKQKAIDCFFQVLRAGSASERLQTLLAERRLLYSVLCELQALEESIFACNNESYFSDYKRIRDNVTLNLRRASLAELKEINPLFAELISERGRLDSLAWATAQIENAVLASEDNGLVVDYANHSRRISQTQRKLQALGEDQAQVCPPFYQETRLKYLNSLAQSAAESLSSEIRNLNAAITTAEQSSNTLMATETERLLRLGVQLDRLTQTLQRSHQQQAQALLAQRRAPESRIAFWSDVSFAHYSIGGMEMDELDRMRERLKQFEEDISVLENVLDIAKKQEPSQSK